MFVLFVIAFSGCSACSQGPGSNTHTGVNEEYEPHKLSQSKCIVTDNWVQFDIIIPTKVVDAEGVFVANEPILWNLKCIASFPKCDGTMTRLSRIKRYSTLPQGMSNPVLDAQVTFVHGLVAEVLWRRQSKFVVDAKRGVVEFTGSISLGTVASGRAKCDYHGPPWIPKDRYMKWILSLIIGIHAAPAVAQPVLVLGDDITSAEVTMHVKLPTLFYFDESFRCYPSVSWIDLEKTPRRASIRFIRPADTPLRDLHGNIECWTDSQWWSFLVCGRPCSVPDSTCRMLVGQKFT